MTTLQIFTPFILILGGLIVALGSGYLIRHNEGQLTVPLFFAGMLFFGLGVAFLFVRL